MAASPYGRPAENYTPERLPQQLQAKTNPHLIPAHRQLQRFAPASAERSVPGVVFTTGGGPVVAVASGIVHFVGQKPLHGSRFGGTYVRIAHDLYEGLQEPFYPRVTLYRPQAYRSTYYGLKNVRVAHWQRVRRGQVIGDGSPAGGSDEPAVKLVLEERDNPVNPDDYGPGHSFMRYVADEKGLEWDLEEIHRRLDRQAAIIHRLQAAVSRGPADDIDRKIHGFIDTEKFTDYPVLWSTVEKFRYLTLRIGENPRFSPGLSAEELDELTRSFFQHQPIAISLPLTADR